VGRSISGHRSPRVNPRDHVTVPNGMVEPRKAAEKRSGVESCGASVRAEAGTPGGLVVVFLLRGVDLLDV
jgi:hypothetical protein